MAPADCRVVVRYDSHCARFRCCAAPVTGFLQDTKTLKKSLLQNG
jgi:hypothetical protein